MINSWVGFLTMLGAFAAVAVVFWELEINRLDRFLESAFSPADFKARKDIYAAYCNCNDKPKSATDTPPNEVFKDLLRSDENLKTKCDQELVLMERIGNGLPFFPPFRRRALSWFPLSVVFLWEILSPYIQYRRESSISTWAGSFVLFASECLEILVQEKKDFFLLDPRPGKKNNIPLPKKRLAEIRDELKKAKVGFSLGHSLIMARFKIDRLVKSLSLGSFVRLRS